MSPAGLGPENDWQTRPLVRESAPYQQTRNCLIVIRILSWTPDGGLTPRQTGRLTVGRNVNLTLTLCRITRSAISEAIFVVSSDYLRYLTYLTRILISSFSILLWHFYLVTFPSVNYFHLTLFLLQPSIFLNVKQCPHLLSSEPLSISCLHIIPSVLQYIPPKRR
jgi:hypothetical protein